MSPALARLIHAVAQDRMSGASELMNLVWDALDRAATEGIPAEVAAALCRAQPSMAPVWNGAIAALETDPAALSRWRERIRRAPVALHRIALAVLAPNPARPLRVVTLSMSGTVARLLRELQNAGLLEGVACAEGRPQFEGRRLATALAASGIRVTFSTDAAIATAFDWGDSLIVGADAVAADRFVNKVGTRALASLAMTRGLPVYVVTTRDKLVMPSLWPHLQTTLGEPGEVWEDPPAGVTIQNPYFEATPLDLVTTLLTDAGALAADMVAPAVEALETPSRRAALAELLQRL